MVLGSLVSMVLGRLVSPSGLFGFNVLVVVGLVMLGRIVASRVILEMVPVPTATLMIVVNVVVVLTLRRLLYEVVVTVAREIASRVLPRANVLPRCVGWLCVICDGVGSG
jgi:hypothetical protein